MSCCGRGVRTPGGAGERAHDPLAGRRRKHRPGDRPTADPTAGPTAGSNAYVQYVGGSELTATGPVSGRSYRFQRPFAVLAVDPRDLAALAAVPNLRRVAGPMSTETT
jgi:hypothetical protein